MLSTTGYIFVFPDFASPPLSSESPLLTLNNPVTLLSFPSLPAIGRNLNRFYFRRFSSPFLPNSCLPPLNDSVSSQLQVVSCKRKDIFLSPVKFIYRRKSLAVCSAISSMDSSPAEISSSLSSLIIIPSLSRDLSRDLQVNLHHQLLGLDQLSPSRPCIFKHTKSRSL